MIGGNINIIYKKIGYDEALLIEYDNPYSSTIEFEKFLKKHSCFVVGTKCLDIGCGTGGPSLYFAQKNPCVNFIGIDYNAYNIELGKSVIRGKPCSNLKLEAGDWFDLKKEYISYFDGIFNINTFCVFRNIEPAIDALATLRPRWIAFKSLFYEGPLDVLIHIRDHNHPQITDDCPDGDFNIFSLNHLKTYLCSLGFNDFFYERFEIPIDLHKKPDGGRGTYTVFAEFQKRAQFSGPVYLPWYFVLAKIDDKA